MQKIKEGLDRGQLAFQLPLEKPEGLNLLTDKLQIYLLNGKEEDASEKLKTKIKSLGASYIAADLSRVEDLNGLVKESYRIVKLISFLTTGEDETRAWTVKRGTKAPQAAGVIHTDFEQKFIRAEVVSYENLVKAGGWNEAKQKGWLRVEGKDYIIEDGDVVSIRHG